MKKAICLLIFCAVAAMCKAQSIHSLTIQDIDGNSVSLSSYQGSKILFFIAPVKQGQAIGINQIDSFKNVYGSKIKLIGIMSREDGYVDSNKARIKSYYQSLGTGIVLTEPMYTRKAAGTNQSGLLKWLTTKSMNTRFEQDAQGMGQKFFIGADGKLFSVLPPELLLFSVPVINNVNRSL